VTGLPFRFGAWGTSSKNPVGPSIDRIDSNKGYTAANCRLVLTCVNMALNDWGLKVFDMIALAYVAKKYGPAEKTKPIGERTKRRMLAAVAARYQRQGAEGEKC